MKIKRSTPLERTHIFWNTTISLDKALLIMVQSIWRYNPKGFTVTIRKKIRGDRKWYSICSKKFSIYEDAKEWSDKRKENLICIKSI